MKNMTYKDIYDQKIIDLLGTSFEKIKDISLNENVDIMKIAEKIGYSFSNDSNYSEDTGISGSIDNESNTIYVNPNEPEYRQRFTVAHELGHGLNHHPGVQYRRTSDFLIKNSLEQVANETAAELLMPKILVKEYINESIDRNDFERTSISKQEMETIIYDVSRRLNVSEQSLNYRIDNLEIFRLV